MFFFLLLFPHFFTNIFFLSCFFPFSLEFVMEKSTRIEYLSTLSWRKNIYHKIFNLLKLLHIFYLNINDVKGKTNKLNTNSSLFTWIWNCQPHSLDFNLTKLTFHFIKNKFYMNYYFKGKFYIKHFRSI